MATRKDVARLAGVSVATVSNVFLGKSFVREATGKKVLDAAKKLNYFPNHTARSLSLGRSNHIGVAINESTNPFHMEVVKYMEDYANRKGFLVTVFDMAGNLNNIPFIERFNLDALVNFTTVGFFEEIFDFLRSRNTVLVNFGTERGLTFGLEYGPAMVEFMKKLAAWGHRTVGYVSTQERRLFSVDRRSRVFLEKRREMGFVESDDLIECGERPAVKSSEFGYTGTKALLKRRSDLTAVFATNDLAAMGAIRALKDSGYRCPEDVSVIGCDNIGISALQVPSLSTIGFDKELYGKKMAEKIIDCILDKESGAGYEFWTPCKAVFRESVCACKAKKEKTGRS